MLELRVNTLTAVNISIQERKSAPPMVFDVVAPGFIYVATKKSFSWLGEIEVGNERRSVATIRRHSFFSSTRDIVLEDGQTYYFYCEKFSTGVYVCEGRSEKYTLYQHKGLNYSVFQGEQQIAAFTKGRVVVGNANEYELRMNDDANAVVLICMVLTISLTQDSYNTGITFDAGNLGPEQRKFDETWQPE